MEEKETQPEKQPEIRPEAQPEAQPQPQAQPELTTVRCGTSQTLVLFGVSQSTKGYPHPSQSSAHALEWVLQKLIHESSRSEFKIMILHVQVPDEDGCNDVDSVYASAADFKHEKEKNKKKSHQLLEFFVNKCNEAKVAVTAWVKIGDPKEVICQEVLRVKPDLLLLGSRGLGPLQRIFVGGVSNYCAKKIECPVLVIKRRPEDMPEDASED